MLYLFIVGEAGSGKSLIMSARNLVAGVEDIHREYNRSQMELYLSEKTRWDSEAPKDRGTAPKKPDLKTLLLPPDSTAPVIIRSLATNASILLFATEADSLQSALSTKNGDASATLRAAWSHESISQARVTDDLRVYCDRPNLSMLLSGTPAQILPLVQGSENGLASRFAFVQLRARRKFVDQFDSAASLPDHVSKSKSVIVTALYEYLLERRFTVLLTVQQRRKFNEVFADAYETNVEDIDGAVTLRSAIIAVRICMVLTVLRCYEANRIVPSEMIATDADFETALALGVYLRLSSGDIVERLRSLQVTSFPKSRLARELLLFSKLPETFITADAIREGLGLSIPEVTVKRLLKNCKLFARTGHGTYAKVTNRAA